MSRASPAPCSPEPERPPPDDTHVLTSAPQEHAHRLWRADGQGPPVVFQHDAYVHTASMSPDGTRVVTAGKDAVRLWREAQSLAALWGIQQTLGKEPLKGIARNATITNTASQVFDGVGKGEFAVGITMEYAAQEYVAGGNKDIEVIYPSEGTFVAPEGMALVKGGPNPAEAKKFYDFLASKQAQEMLVKKFFRRPIRDDVDTTQVGLPRANALKVTAIDDVKLSGEQPAFIASWKEMVAAK